MRALGEARVGRLVGAQHGLIEERQGLLRRSRRITKERPPDARGPEAHALRVDDLQERLAGRRLGMAAKRSQIPDWRARRGAGLGCFR